MSREKIAIVTGATGAIGTAISAGIAATPGYAVVLLARDLVKAERITKEIIAGTGNTRVRFELVDLSRRSQVTALRERWQGPLDVLVNNAAIAPRKRMESAEGIEMQFAVNVLSYLWMTEIFLDVLKESAPSRVVNVASYWAGDLDLDDLEFKRRSYNNDRAYRQSKQANRMLTVAYAERLAPFGITVNTCHPGDVRSALSSDLGFGGHETPTDGADTPVWLATNPIGAEQSGKYFEHRTLRDCRFGQNRDAVKKLYELCQRDPYP